MTGTEPLQFGRSGNRDGVRDPNDSAAENHRAAQGGDEAGDAHLGHPEAVPGADQRTDAQAQQHRGPPGEIPLLEGDGHDHAAETGHRADRQVDVAHDDDHQHTDGQDQHVGVARQQVLEIGGGDHFTAGGDVEEDDQGDQCDDHRIFVQALAQHFLELFHETIPSFPYAFASDVVVMSRISFSWVASRLAISPVMAPSQMV